MLEEIKNELKQFSLPSKPRTFGSDYYFPEEIDKISSPDLGNWMFKLAAWKGYALKLLAMAEIERSWQKSKHDNKIAKRVAQDSIDNKRVTKEYALGQLILTDQEFRTVREQLINKEAEVGGLKQVVEIYTVQLEIISREISRRSLELKLMQSGIIS